MLDNIYVGASGLAAASAGFNATAQNVSNANTPGFSRRGVELSVANPIGDGSVQLGTGVSVDAISRNEAGLLGVQLALAEGEASQSQTLADALAQVEPLVNETLQAGARTELSEFFDAVSLATADPSDPGLRDTVVQSAANVADSVERLAQGFERLREMFAEQLEIEMPPLSQKLQQVAILNQRLAAAGGAHAAPDIADQLDRLLRELGSTSGVAYAISDTGAATVSLGGNVLVEGGDVRELSLSAPNQVQVEADNGAISVEPGGRLGGLVEAYDTVSGYLDQLNTFAQTFADSVNAAQTSGFDRTGAAGSPLFAYDPANPAASLSVSAGFDGNSLAFASSPLAAAGDGGNISSFLDLESSAAALDQITNAVSLDTATATSRADRDALVAADLESLNQNLNGVDIDEEAVNLTTYQTAYQASARVLATANELLGNLLELV